MFYNLKADLKIIYTFFRTRYKINEFDQMNEKIFLRKIHSKFLSQMFGGPANYSYFPG